MLKLKMSSYFCKKTFEHFCKVCDIIQF